MWYRAPSCENTSTAIHLWMQRHLTGYVRILRLVHLQILLEWFSAQISWFHYWGKPRWGWVLNTGTMWRQTASSLIPRHLVFFTSALFRNLALEQTNGYNECRDSIESSMYHFWPPMRRLWAVSRDLSDLLSSISFHNSTFTALVWEVYIVTSLGIGV